ncbi:MAG: flagellar hook-basal body complex protein [Lachnospiraceae bacterium]|nr:flagellar hook-basal body complex protein [Lachnospiraceae bacterium]
MNRAMYSGVAGLKTHQTRMDVIGNNIANVNTVGYKSQSALFSELLYQNSSNASGPNPTTNIGGVNPKQVGLGVKMASISTNITLPGSAETTNNPFDIRITGDAFLIVNNGKDNMFTRDGSFKVDAAGNLVMSSNGYKVMGWQPDPDNPNEIKPDTVSALQIMSAANMTYPPEATTQAYVSGIVDAESPEVNSKDGKLMNLNFYDARGYSYTAKLAIKRVAGSNDTVNSYSCELVKVLDGTGKDVTAESGAMFKNTPVGLLDVKPTTLTAGYTMTQNGNSYEIDYKPDPTKDEHIVYTISDGAGGISAIKYPDGTNTNGTALTEEEAWKGVAEAFGYNDPEEFRKMSSTIETGKLANPATDDTTTYNVATQLATLITQSNLVNAADGVDANTFIFNGKNIDGCVIDFDKDGGAFKGLNGGTGATTILNFGTTGDAASFRNIEIDFSTLSNVGNEKVSTASATNGSLKNLGGGRMVGKMSGLSIGTEGKIYAAYDNGQTKLLGQIATARFANPSGLQKEGENLYTATQNSGEFDGIGVDVTSDGGKMTPGELEMSNVDLSGELTGMIVTQRGFQANSRIITVSDTMLEELINLKR